MYTILELNVVIIIFKLVFYLILNENLFALDVRSLAVAHAQ